MYCSLDYILGIAVGIEFIAACDEHENTIIVDIFVIRLLIQWP
jgi:hypothetical protein